MNRLGTLLLLCKIIVSSAFIQNVPIEKTLNRFHKEFRYVPPLMAKLWERMEIEEDEEPMWYVLNCVAGSELDLLRQCMQITEDMKDVEKLVVPMVSSTRSHGAKRMVTDTKVKYQGYVFAKLRLCEKTYEAIQGLDLCRSWMGTVNQRGYRKLPPAPLALNEIEIENFGLEDIEELEEKVENDDDVIVDTEEEEDLLAAKMEEEVQNVYKGLRVEDMIKVTGKNKFFDEDGIVRRLKGGKVFIRFYTYGSMYEEWLDPSEVRKLTEEEILNGLGGPNQPITQQDIDGPRESDRNDYGDKRLDSRRNQASTFGGAGGVQRGRRQDRTANSFQQGDSLQDQQRNERNWDWYKGNERRKRDGAYEDGEWDMRGSDAQEDVDAQWGRSNPRNPRERQPRTQDKRGNSQDDWNAFVSEVSSSPSNAETDDFFDSLMSDLSNDLDSGKSKGDSFDSSDDDDFFASLMNEIGDDEPPTSNSKNKGTRGKSGKESGEDDFFASLEKELQDVSAAKGGSDDLDDFFSEIASFEDSGSKKSPKTSKVSDSSNDLDDFFNELGSLDESEKSSKEDPEDFFATLEAELESELSSIKQDIPAGGDKATATATMTKSSKKSIAQGSSSLNPAELEKCTVPVLKEMLKDRGLKVSGKKSELIERLVS